MKKPVLVKVKAIDAFTVTTHFGQFHGDPNNRVDKRALRPMVPEDSIPELLRTKKIELLSALDHDEDGGKGGSKSGAESTAGKGARRRGAKTELGTLRAEYKALAGKGPSPSLDVDALKAKIAELKAGGAVPAAPAPAKRKAGSRAKKPAKAVQTVQTDAPAE